MDSRKDFSLLLGHKEYPICSRSLSWATELVQHSWELKSNHKIIRSQKVIGCDWKIRAGREILLVIYLNCWGLLQSKLQELKGTSISFSLYSTIKYSASSSTKQMKKQYETACKFMILYSLSSRSREIFIFDVNPQMSVAKNLFAKRSLSHFWDERKN